jgi:hypothetical protein
MIHVNAQGATLSEIAEKFIDGADTATLIKVLSKRLEANGQLLMIHDKDGDAAEVVSPLLPAPQPSPASDKQQKAAAEAKKKAAAEAKAKAKAEADAKAKAELDAQAAALVDNGGSDDFDTDEDGPTAEEYTIEAVKDALNEFKVKHGLVTARQIMVDAGGSSKLIDIPPANYGKLIAALNEHAAG